MGPAEWRVLLVRCATPRTVTASRRESVRPQQMIGYRIWQAAKGAAAVLSLTCHIWIDTTLQPIQHYNHPIVPCSGAGLSPTRYPQGALSSIQTGPQPIVNIPPVIYRPPHILLSPYLARMFVLSLHPPVLLAIATAILGIRSMSTTCITRAMGYDRLGSRLGSRDRP